MRKFNRKNFETRKILIQKNFVENSDGSCLICFGKTKVICTAMIDNDVPSWLKGKGTGWVTAEYGMLPGSTSSRNRRESKLGKQTGRTTEIQRLIGRSLRSIIDLNCLGEKSIIAARSCVLKSLPGSEMYAGNPARPIKEKQKRDAIYTRFELLEKRLKKNGS